MNLTIETERLVLTAYAETDVDLAIKLFTDPVVVRYAMALMNEEDIRAEMPLWTRRGGNGVIGVWCVSERQGAKVGTGALLPMPVDTAETDTDAVRPGHYPDEEIEIGFFLVRDAWGKGYATEISRALLAFAFASSPLDAVVATHDARNEASRRVLLKSGFRDLGLQRVYGHDGPYLKITREQWLALHGDDGTPALN
ncbi:MAG: GNAT family N-acetyltransferase [Pseudomonadota bacterium]